MKKKVYGEISVIVYKEVEIDNSKLEGLSEDEIDELFVSKAYEEFGGVEKLIGTHGRDEGIHEVFEVEFTELEDIDNK